MFPTRLGCQPPAADLATVRFALSILNECSANSVAFSHRAARLAIKSSASMVIHPMSRKAQVSKAAGAAYLDRNIRTWQAMQKGLDSGEHRPTHLRGRKPV
jgi:hypothetical protein